MIQAEDRTVVVFGSSASKPGSEVYELAYALGRLIGRTGLTLANGGYGGTMTAAARGAVEAGGKTIGVTCTAFGRNGPNPWIQREIKTPTLADRLQTLLRLGQAHFALPGGAGTLLEIAMTWELINKHFLPERPIILVTDFWRPVVEAVAAAEEIDHAYIELCSSLPEVEQWLGGWLAARTGR